MNERAYHVVCRACRTEHLTASESAAPKLSAEHGARLGHRITYWRIA